MEKLFKSILLFTFLGIGITMSFCKKSDKEDSSPSVPIETGTVVDIEGNIYNTVKIGNQWWMAENLRTKKFNDGSSIQLIVNNDEWTGCYYNELPGRCWYNNDSANYANIYGALYNWHVINTGKLAPIGWHIPSWAEWQILSYELGGVAAIGKLKEVGYDHWKEPNSNATNETGFTGLPGGNRTPYNGNFIEMGYYGQWWLSDNYDKSQAYMWSLPYIAVLDFHVGIVSKTTGLSVRCVKN